MHSAPSDTPADFNLAFPPSLLVPGLRSGEPILLDPDTIAPLDASGRGIYSASLYGKHADDLVRGGVKGKVAIKRVEGVRRVPRDARREALLLARIAHPNILALLNAYLVPASSTTSATVLLFTPLYPFTLRDLLASPSFTPLSPVFDPLAHSLARQLTSAIAHLHSHHIAHRDLSPSNIALSSTGAPILIDFGISLTVGDEEPGAMFFQVGTGPYRPPELLFTARTYDPLKLDLWALGVVLAEMFRALELPSPPSSPAGSDSENWEPGEPPDSLDHQMREMQGRNTASAPPRGLPERRPLFVGHQSDFALIGSIFRVIGTPSIETWPEAALLPDFSAFSFKSFSPTKITDHLPYLDKENPIVSVLEGLLRCSAGERELRQVLLESDEVEERERRGWFEACMNLQ